MLTKYMEPVTNLGSKNTRFWNCDSCDFKCSKKSYWDRHVITAKHLKLSNVNGNVSSEKIKQLIYECNICFKIYKSRVGLWKHSKKCKEIVELKKVKEMEEEKPENDIKMLTNIVLELVKTNTEFQKKMMEVCQISNTSIIHSNSHNKTFNLQFFLNETCKDAMNIMDFVDSMTLDFADLEDVGKLGYVEGISNIIIRKLNELDVCKRPIHCSDGKRETLFVKDNNVWEKENGNYDRLRKAIKHITKKNGDLMIPWSKENPSCMDIQHKMNDVYLQIMSQCMGGRESFVESENKIMKKIAKAVLIEK